MQVYFTDLIGRVVHPNVIMGRVVHPDVIMGRVVHPVYYSSHDPDRIIRQINVFVRAMVQKHTDSYPH